MIKGILECDVCEHSKFVGNHAPPVLREQAKESGWGQYRIQSRYAEKRYFDVCPNCEPPKDGKKVERWPNQKISR